jgi:hypothetical protein
MKSDPKAMTIKPCADLELLRQDADGTLTFRLKDHGCLTNAFWIHTSEEIQKDGHVAGTLSMKRVVIGAKGGLTLS